MYRITPTYDGATPFTVNGAHILVLTINKKPRVKMHRARFQVLMYVLDIDNSAHERVWASYPTEDEAQDELDVLVESGWQPLEWEVSVEDYLASGAKEHSKLIASEAITFVNPQLPSLHAMLTTVLQAAPSLAQLDYMAWWLGMWVTDGRSERASISQGGPPQGQPNSHYQIVARLLHYQQLFGEPVTRVFDKKSTAGHPAYYYTYGMGSIAGRVLRLYALINNKHIPHALICDSRDVRCQLLAGIIDGDGYYSVRDNTYEIQAKHLHVIEGYKELAASLGLRNGGIHPNVCTNKATGEQYHGHRIYLSGDMWDAVQFCSATYKQCPAPGTANYVGKTNDSRCYGFTVTQLPEAEYFGFAVHGGINRRFLLQDYTVTHNVCSSQHPLSASHTHAHAHTLTESSMCLCAGASPPSPASSPTTSSPPSPPPPPLPPPPPPPPSPLLPPLLPLPRLCCTWTWIRVRRSIPRPVSSPSTASPPLSSPPPTPASPPPSNPPLLSFYLGSTSLDSNPPLYLSALHSLARRLHAEGGVAPVVVNTGGWVTGLGGTLLSEVVAAIRPSHVVYLGPLPPPHLPPSSPAPICLPPSPPPSPSLPSSEKLRTLSLLSYFLQRTAPPVSFLTAGRLLSAVPPYRLPIAHTRLSLLPPPNPPLPPHLLPAVFNLSLVSLHSSPSPTSPSLGLGLVRSISSTHLYLLTPVGEEVVGRVTHLVRGAEGGGVPGVLVWLGGEGAGQAYMPADALRGGGVAGGAGRGRKNVPRKRLI